MIDALIELQNFWFPLTTALHLLFYSRSVGIFSQVQYNRISPNQEFLRPPAPTQISMHADDWILPKPPLAGNRNANMCVNNITLTVSSLVTETQETFDTKPDFCAVWHIRVWEKSSRGRYDCWTRQIRARTIIPNEPINIWKRDHASGWWFLYVDCIKMI